MKQILGENFKKLVKDCFEIWWQENKEKIYSNYLLSNKKIKKELKHD